MKKIICCIVVLALCIALGACKTEKTDVLQSSTEPTKTTTKKVTTTTEKETTTETTTEAASKPSTSAATQPASSEAATSPPASEAPSITEPKAEALPGNAVLKRGMTNDEYAQAYAVAAEIVRKHMGKSDVDFLNGIVDDIYAIYSSGTHSENAPHYNDVYGALILRRASCAGVTRAVCLCMTIAGIPYEHINEGQQIHQWCRVYVHSQGAYFVVDAQGYYMQPEPSPYAHPAEGLFYNPDDD